MPRWNPDRAWQFIERNKVTVFCGAVGMYEELREAMDRVIVEFDAIARHWRLALLDSPDVPPELRSFFRECFGVEMAFAGDVAGPDLEVAAS
jgi:acyl-coenzyme A synthetase/AMP-(fatty) acid ligase